MLLRGIRDAREYIGLSQRSCATIIGTAQPILSKAENDKLRLADCVAERLAIEVARTFRQSISRSDVGLRYTYNSPMTFTVWGICYNHKKPHEYQISRMTDKCPKCEKK